MGDTSMWSGYPMSEEFVLDDDLFSFEAKVQEINLDETEDSDSEKEVTKSTDLGEFNFEKPSEP